MLHEVSFASYNGRDEVQGWIYVPACKPKGIVQVIHGFGEHSRRYLHMISAFLDAGYIVAADDHVGHGKTAMVNDVWGDWGDKGPHTMMEDEHTLKEITCEKYPDLPYFYGIIYYERFYCQIWKRINRCYHMWNDRYLPWCKRDWREVKNSDRCRSWRRI